MAEIDYEKEMVGTIAVPERDRLDEAALTAWMEANVAGFAGPVSLSKFKGGQSNPTYRVDTPGRSYVCLLYTSPSPRDLSTSRMPSSA